MSKFRKSLTLALGRSSPLRILVLLAVLVGLAVPSGSPWARVGTAIAGSVTIGFEDLAPGTQVSNQYANLGVIFGTGYGGIQTLLPTVVQVSASVAHSGTHVAHIGECPAEVCRKTDVWAQLTLPRHNVSVFVGNLGGTTPVLALTAYDAHGNQISEDTTSLAGNLVNNQLVVQSSTNNIAYIRIHVPDSEYQYPGTNIVIDDLTFDNSAKPLPPDFFISSTSSIYDVGVPQGQSVGATIVIHRMHGSTGNLTFSASSVPGLSYQFSPNPSSGGEGATVTMTISADPFATPIQDAPVTVTATPVPSAGTQSRSLQILVTIQGNYTMVINGIEVTQGTQTQALPLRDPTNPAAPVPYSGAALEAGYKTILRVFVSVLGGPPGGVSGINAVLSGTLSDGTVLSGSGGIEQESAPATVTQQVCQPMRIGACIPNAQRLDTNGAFDFTLPSSWTWTAANMINLKVGLLPPLQSTTQAPEYLPCQDPSCQALGSFALTGVPFTRTTQFTIAPVALTVQGKPGPADPWSVTAGARNLIPLTTHVSDYATSIDITDIVNSGNSRTQKSKDALTRLMLVDLFNYGCGLNDFPIGVSPVDIGMENGTALLSNSDPCLKPYAVVTDAGRPYTSVTHELFHGLGLQHSDQVCGGPQGGGSDPTWPDPYGLLNGVGVDRTGAAPYPVIQPSFGHGNASLINGVYDLMSYCYGSENSVWASPINWDKIINRYRLAQQQAPAAPAAASTSGPTLLVIASDDGSHVAISTVAPGGAASTIAAPASDYHLIVRDRAGRLLADSPMAVTGGRPGAGSGVVSLLEARVPVTGAASVAITHNGVVVASRVRSPHAPQVTFLSPTPGSVIRPSPLSPHVTFVRWQATDADGSPLTAVVEYSADGGHSWRLIYLGPNRNGATLPDSYFTRSSSARLRVLINDGFNQTAAVSGPLTAVGSAPTVHIDSPISDERVMSDARLYLSGQASDDAFHPLKDSQLHWYDGTRLLGVGQSLSVTGLPAGPQSIQLVAIDAQGRVGRASVTIQVRPAAPRFTVLTAPTKLTRTAAAIRLRVASTVPATLLAGFIGAGGQQYAVGPGPVQVNVPVIPGTSLVVLPLQLEANGRITTAVLRIARS